MPRIGLFTHRTVMAGATGIGFYVRRLTSALAAWQGRDGWTLELFAPLESDAAPAGSESLVSDAPAIPLHRPAGNRHALYASWSLLHRPRMDRAFRRPDLLHVLFPATPVPVRGPSVYTVHDLMPLKNPQWYTRQEAWAFDRGIHYAADRADRLLANSEATARELTDVLGVDPARISVVYLAADDSFFRSPDPADVERECESFGLQPGRYLVTIGSVSRRKALTTVLEALAEADLRRCGLQLAAVGPPGDGYPEIVACAERLGLSERVRFTGWLPTRTVAALLSGACGLVHPSLDEGFGITPLEAMARSVPAIVADSGSLPEITGGAALVVPAGDPSAWAGAIRRLADDPGLRDGLIERGRRRASEFTWARTAAATLAAYSHVLDGHAGRR